jgi:MFS superfamily sulfate permease-like transporter
VVLFLGIGISAALDLEGRYGVEVVGALPQGLPSLSFPTLPFTSYLAMILPAIGVLLVAYSEALGVATEFAEKHGYEIDTDQELNAHAGANLISALFGGMIAAGSMSASAVKEGAGARTQVTNLVTWVVTVITLLFLTPLFTTLPEAVLAALIIHAVWHIITSRKLVQVRLVSRTEFWFGVFALLGVLLIDVLQGMLIGLLASLAFVIYRSSRPHISSLGRVPGAPGAFSDLTRHPENIPVPGVLILRLDGPLYYANALTFRNRVKEIVAAAQPPPHAVLFDAAAQDQLDLTSAEVFVRLVKDLRLRGIDVYMADVHAPVRDFSVRAGLIQVIGEGNVFPNVDIAVRALEATSHTTGQTDR